MQPGASTRLAHHDAFPWCPRLQLILMIASPSRYPRAAVVQRAEISLLKLPLPCQRDQYMTSGAAQGVPCAFATRRQTVVEKPSAALACAAATRRRRRVRV